jgi:two-component system sensor histidine kinase PilS (NtrC family)
MLVIGLLFVAVVVSYRPSDQTTLVPFEVSAIACLVMGASALMVRYYKYERWFIWSQMVIDTLFTTTMLLLSGSPDSTYSVIYFMSVVAAARMLSPQGVLMVACINTVAYGLVSAAGLSGHLDWVLRGDIAFNYTQVLVRIFGLLLVGALSTGLVSRGVLFAQIQRTQSLQRAHTALLDRLPVAIVSVEDGIVRDTNAFAVRVLGIRIGVPLMPSFMTDNKDWEICIERDGEPRWLSFRRRDLEGGGQVYIIEDITRLREIEAQLERDDRLTAVGRLAASLAHEIRNPLASLSGSVQLLEEQKANPLHRIILREVERLNDLVEEFLQAARPLKLTVISMSLESLLNEVFQTFQNDPRCRNIRRVTLKVEPLPMLMADPSRLRQVVWNLLVNAVQATDVGGHIEVIALPLKDGVRLIIRDNGIGIEEDKLLHIFDPFYTTRAGGTGLGLANVDRIVRAHGGDVRVDSQIGEGTSFMIWMPCSIRESSDAG